MTKKKLTETLRAEAIRHLYLARCAKADEGVAIRAKEFKEAHAQCAFATAHHIAGTRLGYILADDEGAIQKDSYVDGLRHVAEAQYRIYIAETAALKHLRPTP